MKKLKNEKELVKKAIAIGVAYGEKRGVVEFEPTDSASEKLEYIYRLLVHDKLIQPLPELQVSQETIRHRLAIWASKQKTKEWLRHLTSASSVTTHLQFAAPEAGRWVSVKGRKLPVIISPWASALCIDQTLIGIMMTDSSWPVSVVQTDKKRTLTKQAMQQ